MYFAVSSYKGSTGQYRAVHIPGGNSNHFFMTQLNNGLNNKNSRIVITHNFGIFICIIEWELHSIQFFF